MDGPSEGSIVTLAPMFGRLKQQSLEELEAALTAADDAYETAEAAFLTVVRAHGDRAALRQASQEVADAAHRYNEVAYKCFHVATGERRSELDLLTERTEVLSDLWFDVANAYRE